MLYATFAFVYLLCCVGISTSSHCCLVQMCVCVSFSHWQKSERELSTYTMLIKNDDPMWKWQNKRFCVPKITRNKCDCFRFMNLNFMSVGSCTSTLQCHIRRVSTRFNGKVWLFSVSALLLPLCHSLFPLEKHTRTHSSYIFIEVFITITIGSFVDNFCFAILQSQSFVFCVCLGSLSILSSTFCRIAYNLPWQNK